MLCKRSHSSKGLLMKVQQLTKQLPMFIIIIMSLVLTNCVPIAGRKILALDRNYYNREIMKSDNSQLLLNIVRLRHLDSITFLQINSITAQKTVQGSGSYSDSPTVSFTPLQGADFVNNLVMTVSLKSIFHLINTAWNVEVILMLAIHQLNDNHNELGFVARERNATPYGYKSFLKILRAMRILQQHSALRLDFRMKGDEQLLVFIFNKTRELSTSAEIKHLLHIPADATYMVWSNKYHEHMPKNTVYVRTRSIIQMMSYLANAIQLPPKEIGFPQFYPFQIPEITIYSSQTPVKANICAIYEGNYYYIRNDDAPSKRTFVLFSSFYQLTAGLPGGNNGVALTLPVGK